jgi:peptidoglycan/LPS O-acetylase OafA/YrhL
VASSRVPVSETFAIAEESPTRSAREPSFLQRADLRFRHFPELDGLRGCAVLLVLVGHVLVFKYWRGYRWNLAMLGVLLFFVLSGFLITGLLCSEERRFGTISLKSFYVRRIFRILPAVGAYILVVVGLMQFGLVTDTSRKAIVGSVLFVENIVGGGVTVGHLWSLSLEEQFYLVWPLLFLLLGRRHSLAPAIGLIVGIWVYRAAAIAIAPYDYGLGIFEHRSDFRMDSILVGCALALLLDRREGGRTHFPPLARWATHPVGLVVLLLLWTVNCEVQPLLGLYLSVQTVLVCGLVFHVIAFPDSGLGRLLRMCWLRFVGLISYSLYLWNQLFIATSVPEWGLVRRMPFCLLASAGAALLSYFLIERPFLALKRRLAPEG